MSLAAAVRAERDGVDLLELTDRDLGVSLGRLQLGVAEHLLHEADVGTALEHQRRHGVAEEVTRTRLADVGRPPHGLTRASDRACRIRLLICRCLYSQNATNCQTVCVSIVSLCSAVFTTSTGLIWLPELPAAHRSQRGCLRPALAEVYSRRSSEPNRRPWLRENVSFLPLFESPVSIP